MPKKLAEPVFYELSGLWSDALNAAYESIRERYKSEGKPAVYLNGLQKARLALTRSAPPHQENGWTWVVGSSQNYRSDEAIGYTCIPVRGRCACQDGHMTYDTCQHQERVCLYLEAKARNERLRRPAPGDGISSVHSGDTAATTLALHP